MAVDIARAAAVEPIRHLGRRIAWLAWAATVQCIWGLYSVCMRYLQVHPRVRIPSLQLAAVIAILCWPVTVVIVYAPIAWAHVAERGSSREAAAAAAAATAGAQPHLAARAAAALEGEAAEPPPPPPTPPPPPAPARGAASWARWARLQALSHAVGAIIAAATLGLLCATLFVPAFLVQLLMVLIPLFTALGSRTLLRQRTPYMLWPALVLGMAGSVLVVVGAWLERGGGGGGGGGPPGLSANASLFIGLGVSLASAVLFAGYYVALQATRRLLTTPQQVMASRNASVLLLVPLALAVEGADWGWLRALSAADWSVLLFAALVAFTLGSLGLQWCTRALGGAVVSQFSCLRLVAAIAGSAALLGEVPRGAATWAGFLVVVLSMAGWLALVARHESGQVAEAAATAMDEAAAAAAADVEAGAAWPSQAAAQAGAAAAGAAPCEKKPERQPSLKLVRVESGRGH